MTHDRNPHSDVYSADGLGQIPPWVLGFTGSNGSDLRSDIRERCLDEDFRRRKPAAGQGKRGGDEKESP